jgi:two-component system, response regulator PdtaR
VLNTVGVMHDLAQGSGYARRSPATHSSRDNAFEAMRHAVRLLVVEDDYLVGLELEYHLTAAGFAVVGIAATADEALAMAASDKPELAIVDIRLADERDGVDAAIELNTRFGIRSIFATAHADADTRRRGDAANPVAWLQKPYTPETLIALINETLRRRAG